MLLPQTIVENQPVQFLLEQDGLVGDIPTCFARIVKYKCKHRYDIYAW